MITVTLFIAMVLLALSLTVVFYASKMPGTLGVRTAVAAAGFVLLTIALFMIGALG
jgi:hypothetical protein